MKKLRSLAVSFDTHLAPWELPRFRGAIAQKVGLEHEWFHNHNAGTGGFHHRYPLIQYKIEPREGVFRPMLLCLESGVEAAHHFFSQPDWNLQIGERELPLRIANLNVQQTVLDVWEEKQFRYRIHNWQALNPEIYKEYRDLRGLRKKLELLERMLTAHLLSFAKGVDWHIEKPFKPSILDIQKEDWMQFKDVKVLGFTLDFECPLSLPEWIGLGKGVSIGWGVVRRQ